MHSDSVRSERAATTLLSLATATAWTAGGIGAAGFIGGLIIALRSEETVANLSGAVHTEYPYVALGVTVMLSSVLFALVYLTLAMYVQMRAAAHLEDRIEARVEGRVGRGPSSSDNRPPLVGSQVAALSQRQPAVDPREVGGSFVRADGVPTSALSIHRIAYLRENAPLPGTRADWLTDPTNPSGARWWDGTGWGEAATLTPPLN